MTTQEQAPGALVKVLEPGISRALELHKPAPGHIMHGVAPGSPSDYDVCPKCFDDDGWPTPYPCPTVAALTDAAAGFGDAAEVKAQALEEAASLVASEEQHQWHRDSQHLPGAQIVAQRMQVLVRILRARAAALRGEG